MISVALDIRRLVDAQIQRQAYQGITRYTLRLYQELKACPDAVELYPVYLHPLDPKRVGMEKALQHSSALDVLQRTICGPVELPFIRPGAGTPLLRTLHRIESRLAPGSRLGQAVRIIQHRIFARCFLPSSQPRIRTDVFHSPVNPLPALRRTPSRSRVLTVHDCIYLKHPELYPIPGRTPAIRRALDSLDVEHDLVICDSQSTKNDLLELSEFPASRMTVVPLAADEGFFRPQTAAGLDRLSEIGVVPGRFLLALAQSEKRKNIPRLVEAYRRSGSAADVAMVLVASESHAPALRRALVDAGQWSDNLHILTGIDDTTLSGLLSLALAFVYVPLYEGFGIPILEAMAAGCPVLTARNSSIPEVASDAALYVDAEDVAGIAAGIQEIVCNGALRDELIAGGRARAATFSWRRTAEETLAVYREAVERAAVADSESAGSESGGARVPPSDPSRRRTTRAGAASSPRSGSGRHSSS